jgi:hypothetical protein
VRSASAGAMDAAGGGQGDGWEATGAGGSEVPSNAAEAAAIESLEAAAAASAAAANADLAAAASVAGGTSEAGGASAGAAGGAGRPCLAGSSFQNVLTL